MEQMIKNIQETKSSQDIERELNFSSSRKGCTNKHGNSATINQSYWWLRRFNKLNKEICSTLPLFSKVIQTINSYLREAFIDGDTIYFPHGMGRLSLEQHELIPKYENGYLGNNLPVDWASTRKLWIEDKDARKKKTLIRHINRIMYRIKYYNQRCSYINKSFYDFTPCRLLQRGLAHKAKNNEVNNAIYQFK